MLDRTLKSISYTIDSLLLYSRDCEIIQDYYIYCLKIPNPVSSTGDLQAKFQDLTYKALTKYELKKRSVYPLRWFSETCENHVTLRQYSYQLMNVHVKIIFNLSTVLSFIGVVPNKTNCLDYYYSFYIQIDLHYIYNTYNHGTYIVW